MLPLNQLTYPRIIEWLKRSNITMWNLSGIKIEELTNQYDLAALMLAHLQRHTLKLQLILGTGAAVFWGVIMTIQSITNPDYKNYLIVLHILRIFMVLSITLWYIKKGNIITAWSALVISSVSASFIFLIIEDILGVIILDIFTFVVPSLVLPIRKNIQFLLFSFTGYIMLAIVKKVDLEQWILFQLLFFFIIIWILYFGVLLRKFISMFARVTILMKQESESRARNQQRIDDLITHVSQIATLEHDIRQPLRAIQGYLEVIRDEQPDISNLVLPALGAVYRSERIINNLLDSAKSKLSMQQPEVRSFDLQASFRRLENVTQGLAHYYTYPVIPIIFSCNINTCLKLPEEKFERAILNCVDNSLKVAPQGSIISIYSFIQAHKLCICIADQGPGLPQQVIAALNNSNDQDLQSHVQGLGLRQILSFVQEANATIYVESSPYGTKVKFLFDYENV